MKAHDQTSERPTAAMATARLGPEAALDWRAQTFLANRDAIIVTDTDGRILDWNPAAERIYGYTRDEVLGQTTAFIHRPEDVPTLTRNILDGMTRDESWSGEIIFRRKDGSTCVCETTVSPLKDEQGQVVGAFGVNRDITARKRLEAEHETALAVAREARHAAEVARAEAEAARTRLQTVLDVLPIGVGMADAQGAAVHINPAYDALWGKIATLPEGVEAFQIFRGWWPTTGAPIQPDEWATARALLNGETVRDEEVEIETFDGQRKTVLTHAAPIRGDAGAIVGAVVAQQDITERKRTESEREQALAAAQARASELDTVFAAAADGIAIYDPAGRLVQWNAALATLFEFERQPEYASLPVDVRPGRISVRDPRGHTIPADDLPFMRATRGEVLTGAHAVDLVVTLPSGRVAEVSASAAPLRDAEGQVIGAVTIYRDVTERRHAEERLRESEERFRTLADDAPLFIWMADARASVTYANQAMRRFVGAGDDRFGFDMSAWLTAVHPKDLDRVFALYGRALRERAPYELEVRFLEAATGEYKWYLVNGVPRTVAGAFAGFIGTGVDIHARKLAEEALRESEEKFRTLAENIPAFAWMARPDGYIFWYNQRWYDYTGTTPETQVGWGWQSVHDPDVLPRVTERWQQSLATGQPFEMVFPLRGADGVFRPFLTRVAPITDAQGQVVRWFGTNIDVTEQQAAEEALRAANVALKAANQAKDEFLGIASHELRTPLTSITMNVQLANRQLHDLSCGEAAAGDAALRQRLVRTEHLLERTQRQVGRMGRLVGDLIDTSRIQVGKLDLHMEPCDLAEIVRDAVQEQRAAWPGRHIEPALPTHGPIPILADADRIGQVVTNYVTNALKYSAGNCPVEVRVATVAGGMVRVEVRDQGPGLTAEQQEHLFERFYRVPGIAQQSGSGVGLGLGLYICQTIVERHGGTVGVASVPGTGSTFWFTLPLASAASETERDG